MKSVVSTVSGGGPASGHGPYWDGRAESTKTRILTETNYTPIVMVIDDDGVGDDCCVLR
jgi:hypothetical protein